MWASAQEYKTSTWKVLAFKEQLQSKERTLGVTLDFQTALDYMLTAM